MGGMIDINVTLVIQVANFLLLMFAMERLLYRPLLRGMDARRERIGRLHREAETLRNALSLEEKSFEERLDGERAAAVPQRLQQIAEAYDSYRDRLAEARRLADTRIREASETVIEARREAWKALEAEVPGLTEDLVDRLMAENGRPS